MIFKNSMTVKRFLKIMKYFHQYKNKTMSKQCDNPNSANQQKILLSIGDKYKFLQLKTQKSDT